MTSAKMLRHQTLIVRTSSEPTWAHASIFRMWINHLFYTPRHKEKRKKSLKIVVACDE